MPSYLDLALIAVVLVSGVLSMLRGFTREVLAIASWAAAAFAAYYLHPLLLPYVTPHIGRSHRRDIPSDADHSLDDYGAHLRRYP